MRGFPSVFTHILICFIYFFSATVRAQMNASCNRTSIFIDWKYPMISKAVVCSNFSSAEDFTQSIRQLKPYDSVYAKIEYSKLEFFNHDAFQNRKIKIMVIDHSTITSLSDTSVAFEGLEDTLQVFAVYHSTNVGNWNWNHLKNLRKIDQISVQNSDLDQVYDFPNFSPDTFKRIDFTECRVKSLSANAFSQVKGLEKLDLNFNEIETLQRSSLPRPAERLVTLSLVQNKIKYLPSDFFADMPVLKNLLLNSNQIETLDEATWKPIWSQLKAFAIGGDLICDCRLKWLLRENYHWNLHCASPPRLEGKAISKLDEDDLKC